MAEWIAGEALPRELLLDHFERLEFASEQQDRFLKEVRESFYKHSVTLDCDVGPLGITAVVRALVPQPLLPKQWSHQLRNLLNDYRGALDSFAFTLANIVRDEPMTDKEAKGVYFPLARTESDWNKLVTKKGSWLATLPHWMLERLRLVQPFLLPDVDNSLLLWLHETDILGKHRWGLTLRPVLDPQMPHIFQAVGVDGQEVQVPPGNERRENVGELLNDGQLVYRLTLPIRSIRVFSNHTPFLALWIARGGETADLQDFLYAVNLKIQQVFRAMFAPGQPMPEEAFHQLQQLPDLFRKRWDVNLDDPGSRINLLVRPEADPSIPLTFTGRNDDDLITLMNREVGRWESLNGQAMPFFGYKGNIDFVNVYYPDERHGPASGTLRSRFLPTATVYDLRRMFGNDIAADPPVLEVEINTGRGGGGLVEILNGSLQVTQTILEVYGGFEAGRRGIEFITKRLLAAPFDAVQEYATTLIVPTRLIEYLQRYPEWKLLEVQKLFECSATEAAEFLRAADFFSPERSGNHWIRRFPRAT